MIQSTLRMEFTPQKLNEAVAILRSVIEGTRAERGCIDCSVYRDTQRGDVVYEEKWGSDEDLQRHLRSGGYRKVLQVMEMASSPPDISFDTIVNTSGFEVIVKARTGSEHE